MDGTNGTNGDARDEYLHLPRPEIPGEEIVAISTTIGAPEEELVITAPVARYFALLTGVALTIWGILGFIPLFTQGGALFDIVRVTPASNVLHVVTGLPGLVVWRLPHKRYATWYGIFLAAVYLIYFSAANIVFGNLEGTVNLDVGLHRLQWVVFVGLQVGLMLAGFLIAALAATQHGDRATRRYRGERRWFWESRTRLPTHA